MIRFTRSRLHSRRWPNNPSEVGWPSPVETTESPLAADRTSAPNSDLTRSGFSKSWRGLTSFGLETGWPVLARARHIQETGRQQNSTGDSAGER